MGSIRIMSVAGIPVHVHVTLILTFLLLTGQWGAWGVPAGLLLFGSVLLHELGHALVARAYGLPTLGIHLHLLGGVAMMGAQPRRPEHEVRIAAAGPAVSAALAMVFGLAASVFGAELPWRNPRAVDLLAYAALLNGAMAVFNLIPALPMDGGRILRAWLSGRHGNLSATRMAARVSRVFGGLFVLGGLLGGAWSLALIGLLLFWMSRREETLANQVDAAARSRDTPPNLAWPPPGVRRGVEHVARPLGSDDRRRWVILEP